MFIYVNEQIFFFMVLVNKRNIERIHFLLPGSRTHDLGITKPMKTRIYHYISEHLLAVLGKLLLKVMHYNIVLLPKK